MPLGLSELGDWWRGQYFVVVLVFVVHFSLSQEMTTSLALAISWSESRSTIE
jgi:hypothetical protein